MKYLYAFSIVICFFGAVSCSTSKEVLFSDEDWSLSRYSGNMINSDSTLQFSFGNHLLNPNMTIISNKDSLAVYPNSDKYINRVLQICGLEGSKVYFFAPMEHTMWVELPTDFVDIKPRAVISNLSDENPYTSWIWDDDSYEGNRTPEDIYSNTFVDKKHETIIVVDKLNYGKIPMACLSIYQAATKRVSEIGFKPWHWTCKGSILDYSYIDILANWVDSRRENLINNYRLGQSVDYRRNVNTIRIELKEILRKDQEPRNRICLAWQEHPNDTLLHRQIAREILTNDSVNLVQVCEILDNYSLDFGEENEILWAVIQHSNLETQIKYLPKFIEAAQKGKLKRELVAVMQDRVACWSGKPQIYGSQGNINELGIFVPAEIEDPENVDIRRASMGMCPLKDYIEQMSRH